MSTLTTLPTDPTELRPLVHEGVDRLPDASLAAVHKLLLELELDEVSERLNADFDEDRAAGRFERLPELIRAARNC